MLATSHVLTCSTGPARYGFMRYVRDARRAALHGESHPELAHRVGGALSDAAAAQLLEITHQIVDKPRRAGPSLIGPMDVGSPADDPFRTALPPLVCRISGASFPDALT